MPSDARLETDPNLWQGKEIYILTSLQPVKARSLLANPRASIALENGSTPLIADCAAPVLRGIVCWPKAVFSRLHFRS
jgi:hypothetical protein